jgi:hypothetical protein
MESLLCEIVSLGEEVVLGFRSGQTFPGLVTDSEFENLRKLTVNQMNPQTQEVVTQEVFFNSDDLAFVARQPLAQDESKIILEN